jgi:hypothetical protein
MLARQSARICQLALLRKYNSRPTPPHLRRKRCHSQRPHFPFSFTVGLPMLPSEIGAFIGYSGIVAIPIMLKTFPPLDTKLARSNQSASI